MNEKTIVISIYKCSTGYVVAADQVWVPGVYETEDAAAIAGACPEVADLAWPNAHGHPMSKKFLREFI